MTLRLGDLAPDCDAETTENDATTYPATLVSVDTGCAFDEFEQKLHRAVPEAPMFLLSALIAQCAQWDEIVSATTDHAPYGFVRYWSSPSSRLMHAAGHHGCASSYLIGNYELAEQSTVTTRPPCCTLPCGWSCTSSKRQPRCCPSICPAPSSRASAISGSQRWAKPSMRSSLPFSNTSAHRCRANCARWEEPLDRETSLATWCRDARRPLLPTRRT